MDQIDALTAALYKRDAELAARDAEIERLTQQMDEVRRSRDETFQRSERTAQAAIELDRKRTGELAARDAEIVARDLRIEALQSSIDGCAQRVAELRERNRELEDLVVWAVRHGVSEGYDGNCDPCVWYSSHKLVDGRAVSHEKFIGIDATDADILRAVATARSEEK